MSDKAEKLHIRAATPNDVGVLLGLIREIAAFEKLSDQVVADETTLTESLFGDRPAAESVIAEWAGEPVGYAIWFTTFSTFVGRAGIWLEDVYVQPDHRAKGIGRALIEHVGGVAQERGAGRFEWAVLDWNKRAIDFYESLGAKPMSDWMIYRLDGKPLADLGA